MNVFDPVPPSAETFDFGIVLKQRRAPSRFLPGQSAIVEELICPKCSSVMLDEHPIDGKTYNCKCGIAVQLRWMQARVWARVAVVA